MKRRLTTVVLVVTAMVALSGCTESSREAVVPAGKVSDQQLTVYGTQRRLSYKDTCGNNGPLAVCVDRIAISETSTVIEARVRNSTQSAYSYGYTSDAPVALVNERGATLLHPSENHSAIKERFEPGETPVKFSLAGRLEGEPAIFSLNGIQLPDEARTNLVQGDEFSIQVRLGGG
ncbi:MAG: hypothetical protein ACLGPL_12020 [Acidobacteriota bacterium]